MKREHPGFDMEKIAVQKHTPGPWKLMLQPNYVNADIKGKGGQHVAQVWSGNARTMNVVEANASLIASAPELLEALELALDAMVSADCGTITVVPKLRAVMRKARGE